MPACFAEWDVSRGRVVWSPSVAELVGVAPSEEAAPLAWWEARIHPEDRDAAAGLERALAGDAERWVGHYRVRDASGAWLRVHERAFLVRKDGRALRVVRAVDTEEIEPEEAQDRDDLLARLARSEDQFRTFVESIAQLAWTMTPDGWIDYYNQRWYDYTGTRFEDMEGWGWVQVHDPDDLPRILRIFRNSLTSGEPWEDEFRLRRADGAMRWHLSRALPLRDAEGRIVRWFGTNTDVHDQKLALEERSLLLQREQEARRQAEEANHAKDEFLAVVSHELRTPLNAILGWATLLRSGMLGEDQRHEALETIERCAKHQGVLIEDLLDTSRILSGRLQIERESVRGLDAVRAALEAMRPAAEEKRVVLALHESGSEDHVLGDRDRLEQVVTNLLSNAVKFSAPGGRVDVRVVGEEDAVVVEVADEGEGIEEHLLPRLFDSFRQAEGSTTRRHGGLGLGLSIARRIVDLHGGEIGVWSEGKGRGATFTVRLPRASAGEAARGKQAAQAPDAKPVSLRGLSILAVDDDPHTRQLVATLLLASGASVVTAGSVAEALVALRSNPPDAIVCDVAMPEVDGYGFVQRLRALPDARLAGTPTLALTAFASLQDRDRALASGFDDYLAKPVHPAELSRALAALVRRRSIGPEGQRALRE